MGKRIFITFLLFVVVLASFTSGWISSDFYHNILSKLSIRPKTDENESFKDRLIGREQLSPYDWIKEEQIQLFPDKIIITIDSPHWSVFEDTNSMDPTLDVNSHGIEIIPKTPEDIHLGDIVSYYPIKIHTPVLHRVIEIGSDNMGWYFRARGDNNPFDDPGKIRFDQISRVLVMIIY